MRDFTRNKSVLNIDFGSLLRFLETLDQEVKGRQTAFPPQEIRALLQKLAKGELPVAARQELCKKLLEEPTWLAWQAEQIKALRRNEAGMGENQIEA